MMRDKETNSWWSIMSAKAVDGDMKGALLQETSLGEKVQWAEWVRRHPDTQVLSVKGVTHEKENPYQEYFDSGDTFRSIMPDDNRLPPKTPIFAFRHDGKTFAIPHSVIEGGQTVNLAGSSGPEVFFWRKPGADLFDTSHGFRLEESLDGAEGLQAYEAVRETADRVIGIDTYWYNWVPQNPGTRLLP